MAALTGCIHTNAQIYVCLTVCTLISYKSIQKFRITEERIAMHRRIDFLSPTPSKHDLKGEKSPNYIQYFRKPEPDSIYIFSMYLKTNLPYPSLCKIREENRNVRIKNLKQMITCRKKKSVLG